MTSANYRLGVDAGGTFTDFLLQASDGTRLVHKVSSTPDDPARAVAAGLADLGGMTGLGLSGFLGALEYIIHGTTVATNAVLTRAGAAVGAIVTDGFRDTLTLRDGTRRSPYDNLVPPPLALAPRRRILPVPGRVDHTGQELIPLDEAAVEARARALGAGGAEAVVVCLLHSTVNPAHEQRAAEIVRRVLKDAHVVVAGELLPVVGYYDRLSTAVLNAYVTPVMARYVSSLTGFLAEMGFGGTLVLMQSNGGVASVDEVRSRAVNSILSGPATAPIAGGAAVRQLGLSDATVVDMGGTSFDATVLRAGRAAVVNDGWIDDHRLALPMLDIHTVGAGGGSIAHVTGGGLLRVGPRSAGAVPGPACYSRGGNQATVTDADVVLGYVDPGTFLGGRVPLDAEAARKAVRDHVAGPLGLGLERAAGGIFRVINVSMASAVRAITLNRGIDPRDLPLVVAGGAGPIHGAAIAWEMEIPLLVIPRHSSVFCAAGMLQADFRHDYVTSFHGQLPNLDVEALSDLWGEMRERGLKRLGTEGISHDQVEIQPAIDLRYSGQWSELRIEADVSRIDGPDAAELAQAFHRLHEERFGYASAGSVIESVAARLTVTGRLPRAESHKSEVTESTDARSHNSRLAWSPGRQSMVEHAVYDGDQLGTGAAVIGPALIELGVTTILVPEEYGAIVDRGESFVLYLRAASERVKGLLESAGAAVLPDP